MQGRAVGYNQASTEGRQVIPADPTAPPLIAKPLLVFLAVEWLVWLFLKHFLQNVPRCPLCSSRFSWSEIERRGSHGAGWRPLSFPCPRCRQIVGVPSWRKSFLWILYLSLIAIFFYLIFELPGDLFLGFVGMVIGAVGAIRIADWFVWKKLEPGRPN